MTPWSNSTQAGQTVGVQMCQTLKLLRKWSFPDWLKPYSVNKRILIIWRGGTARRSRQLWLTTSPGTGPTSARQTPSSTWLPSLHRCELVCGIRGKTSVFACIEDAGIGARLLAGCSTGAMAVAVAQPTDVVKIRFQAQVRLPGGGTVSRYSNTFDAYKTIARDEGVRGLWKGEQEDWAF